MTHSPLEERHGYLRPLASSALALALLVGSALSVGACGDDDSSPETDGGDGDNNGGDGGDTTGPAGSIDEATLAKCPQATTLLETTEWMRCLEGKRLTGVEPFTDLPCELRIGKEGTFEYARDGAVAIAVPERSTWRSPSGTYQNEAISGSRFFLASITPDLPAVEGEARVTGVSISLFTLASQDDVVEVRYLDAGLTRQTYNCTVEAL